MLQIRSFCCAGEPARVVTSRFLLTRRAAVFRDAAGRIDLR
jgi:hypothetical protein